MEPGGEPQRLDGENTQPIQTGMAVRYSRSRQSSRAVSANSRFAAMGRRIWSQNIGREIASSPWAQTVRTTAEQTIHSADRITRALTLGTQ